jgi:hypothetical protein
MFINARVLIAVVTIVAAAAIAPSTAGAWAPAASATVHPGVQTFTEGGQCTANFIFTAGGNTYIGQAAHCASTGAATDTDGCLAASRPLGTPVEITGASRPGTLAYSSWLTMQANGESNADVCAYNDFALVRIDPADVAKVNPSVPGFGGPVGVGGPSATGDDVFSYGNSSLRLGITQLSPKRGIVVTTEGNGWSRTVYTVTPGIPGDSGSGFLNGSGQAIGTLSTVAIAPLAGSNGVADLSRELAYARAQGGLADLQLANGTEAFTPDVVGAILGAG